MQESRGLGKSHLPKSSGKKVNSHSAESGSVADVNWEISSLSYRRPHHLSSKLEVSLSCLVVPTIVSKEKAVASPKHTKTETS